MSLLTELEILSDGFLQRCHAYGAGIHLHIGRPPRANAVLGGEGAINLFRRRGDADAMDEVGGHRTSHLLFRDFLLALVLASFWLNRNSTLWRAFFNSPTVPMLRDK